MHVYKPKMQNAKSKGGKKPKKSACMAKRKDERHIYIYKRKSVNHMHIKEKMKEDIFGQQMCAHESYIRERKMKDERF